MTEKNKKLTDLFSIKPTSAQSSEITDIKSVPSKSPSIETQRQSIIKSIMEDTDKKSEEKTKIWLDNKEETKTSLGDIPVPKSETFSAPVRSRFNDSNDAGQKPKSTDYSPPRRRRPQTARKGILDDPLGLFSTSGKSSLDYEAANTSPVL